MSRAVVKSGAEGGRAPCAAASLDALEGRELPVAPLACHTGTQFVVQGRHALVLYTYPGCVWSVGDGYDSPTRDVLQHQRFAARQTEFRALECPVVGVSSQSVELQRDARVPHLLLSDPELKLAHELGLPTFEADGGEFYHRLVLLVIERSIVRVFYPLVSIEENVTDVIRLLHTQRNECRL